MTTRANYFSKMMQNGAMTPNEIREKEGYPTYKDGDNFYIAMNNFTPVDRMDEVIDAQIAKGSGQENKSEEPTKVEEPEDKELTQAAIKFLKGR
jgi:hypothetical protein